MINNGIDYYPTECNDDIASELIEAEFGSDGFLVVQKLYRNIFGLKGYYYEWSEDIALLFAMRYRIDAEKLDRIIEATLKRGIFDRDQFEKNHILTSGKIQSIYFEITKRRKEVFADARYLIGDHYRKYKNVKVVSENGIIIPTVENEPKKEKTPAPKKDKHRKCEIKPFGEQKKQDENEPQKSASAKMYGRYSNVKLSEAEYNALCQSIPDADRYIDRFSQKLHDKGYCYSNHFDTIMDWWRKDKDIISNAVPSNIPKTDHTENSIFADKSSSFDINELFSKLCEKSMMELEKGAK